MKETGTIQEVGSQGGGQKRDREQIKTGPQAPFFGRGLAVAGADGTLGIMGMEASPDGIFKSWSRSCCKQPQGHQ